MIRWPNCVVFNDEQEFMEKPENWVIILLIPLEILDNRNHILVFILGMI